MRLGQFEEAVQIIRRMWTGPPAPFTGKHYSIAGAYCEPTPRPTPPILIGGRRAAHAADRGPARRLVEPAEWVGGDRPAQARHPCRLLRRARPRSGDDREDLGDRLRRAGRQCPGGAMPGRGQSLLSPGRAGGIGRGDTGDGGRAPGPLPRARRVPLHPAVGGLPPAGRCAPVHGGGRAGAAAWRLTSCQAR
ncbi:MAG: LLM class flavin-dependent oxidoreductase [Chloroflexi bacterium]|nr:LLM class flavin-dependent oxidoreductase [Chloroflexota bacterium]